LLSARTLGFGHRLDAVPTRLLRICVLMQAPANPYYRLLAEGFAAANRDLAAARVASYVFHIEAEEPVSIARELDRVATGYDALVVVVPARANIRERLREIAGRMPVVAIATGLDHDIPHRYVGPDNYRVGRLAGELMGRMIGHQSGVLVVGGLPSFRGHLERRAGFGDVLAESYPQARIAEVIESGDQGSAAARAIARALRVDPSIGGIYNITQGNLEIVDRAIATRPGDRPIIVCHDLTPVTVQLLRQGRVDVVLDQDPALEARRAVEIVLHHYGRCEGEVPTGEIPVRPVFREGL
jgi:LacI family transcriptional regulator